MRLTQITKKTLRRSIASSIVSILLAAPLQAQFEKGNAEPQVAPDLQMIFQKTTTARTVTEYSSIIDFCRNVMGDSTRPANERTYAKNLLSWAANKRGEARSDRASELVLEQKINEAKQMDELALEDFELSIKHDPSRWRAHHNRGIILSLRGDASTAIDEFNKVLELNPTCANAHFNRGEVYFQNKRFDAAIADYSKAIALDPKDASLLSARGHAKFARGLAREALEDYQLALELDPNSAKVATEYADACQSLGLWQQAAESYQRALQLDPSDVRTLQNAAWMMATCPEEFYRDGKAALQTINKAIDRTDPSETSVNLFDVLAAAYAADGDFNKAQETIRKALKLTTDPSMRRELLARGNLYQRHKPYLQSSGKEPEQRTAPVRNAGNATRRRG